MKVFSSKIFKNGRNRDAQAMVEYVLAAGILLACVSVMAVLLYALREHAHRVLTLIGSDYP